MCHRRNWNRRIIDNWKSWPWWPDSNKRVSGEPGAIQLQVMLEQASFIEIRITPKDESREFISDWVPGSGVEDYVVSAHIEAVKPK